MFASTLLKSCSQNTAKFTGKHARQPLFNMQNSQEDSSAGAYFSDRVAALQSAILSKKRLQHMCLPVNFCEIYQNDFFTNTNVQLLLFDEQSESYIVDCCTTLCHPLYQSLSLVIICCHSLSRDV